MPYRVLKYPVDLSKVQENHFFFDLPEDSVPLSAINHRETLMVHATIPDDRKRTVSYSFLIVQTGHEISPLPETARFLGTVSLYGGTLVFHVWYIGKSS